MEIGLILIGGAILLLFAIIVFYNVRYKMKTAPKKEKPKEEKPAKEKKEKVKQEKAEKKPKNNDNELLRKDAFVRPSDIAKQQQAIRKQQEEERRKAEEQKRAEEEAKMKAEEEARIKAEEEARASKVGEGYTSNRDFQGFGDRPLTEGKPDEEVEIIKPDISEEIKNLSPEMKALLFGDVLKPKK